MAFYLVDDPSNPKRKRRVALVCLRSDSPMGFVDGLELDGVELEAVLAKTRAFAPAPTRLSDDVRLPSLRASLGHERRSAASGEVRAPMAGRIVEVLTQVGAEVAPGEPLVVLEAMKTEQTLVAPAGGVVAAVLCAAAQQVTDGAVLVRLSVPDNTKT